MQRVPLRWNGGGRFGRGVAAIAGATVLAQGISFLASPFIARLYSPGEFGIYGIYAAVVGILLPIASLRYEMAIPLPHDDDEAAALLRLSLAIALAFASLVGLVCGVEGQQIAEILHVPTIRSVLWAIPFGVAALGIHQALTSWAVRANAYRALSQTKLTQGIGQVLTQAGLGLTALGPAGLIVGDLVGRAGGVWRLTKEARRSAAVTRAVPLQQARVQARLYSRFPTYTAPAALLNALAPQVPALVLAALFGPAVAGFFAFGQRLLAAPLTLVGRSVGQVFQSEVARLLREDPDSILPLFSRTAARLLVVAGIPIGIGAMLAPPVFALLFGERWREAGVFVQALALSYAGEIVVAPLSSIPALVQRQEIELAITIGRTLIVALCFAAVPFFHLTALTTMWLYSIGMGAAYVAFFAMYRRVLIDRAPAVRVVEVFGR